MSWGHEFFSPYYPWLIFWLKQRTIWKVQLKRAPTEPDIRDRWSPKKRNNWLHYNAVTIHYTLRIWNYKNSFWEKCYFGPNGQAYSSFFKPNQSLLQSISTSHWCSFFLSTALSKKGPKLSCQPHKFSTRLWVLMVPAYQEAIKSRLVNRLSSRKTKLSFIRLDNSFCHFAQPHFSQLLMI